jgi:quercetin dioxygenase-like cupin family protein
MDVEHRRASGPTPDADAIAAVVRREAHDVYGWSNGPGDRYAAHDHTYTKLLYCTRGSIDFVLADGRRIPLRAGDGMVLPAMTRHSAIVGPEGCACVEGKLN